MRLRNKGVHASHIWILNLAISDLLTVMLSIPLHTAIEAQESFPFGPVICAGVETISQLCDWVSMCSVFFMATTRAIGVLFPFDFKFLRQKYFNYGAIIFTWFTGLLTVIPFISYMEFKNICEVPYEVGFWPRQMDWDDKGNLTNINMNEVLMTWENLAFDYNCDMDQVIPGYEFEFGHNITTVGDWFRDVIKPFPKVTALRRISLERLTAMTFCHL